MTAHLPLIDIIKTRITKDSAEQGAMPLADYMALALNHPQHGYYMARPVLGGAHAGGDFITAPEISQIFGELIGLWCASFWQRMHKSNIEKSQLALVELGGGRGTLMADAVRAAAIVPEFCDKTQLHLVETSPLLRTAQQKSVPQAKMHQSIATLPTDSPLLIIANEFFDALPIAQYRKKAQGWAEICIAVAADKLVFRDGKQLTQPFSDVQRTLLPDAPQIGDIVETHRAAEVLLTALASRIKRQGGAMLIIDYGYARPAFGSTLQAVEAHRMTDPLARPGMADLTAHINFAVLAACGRAGGLRASPIITQGQFLHNIGLDMRVAALCAANPHHAAAFRAEQRRLAAPEQMGNLFKVLALRAADMPEFEGFEGFTNG